MVLIRHTNLDYKVRVIGIALVVKLVSTLFVGRY